MRRRQIRLWQDDSSESHVTLNLILSVERGDEQKVISKTEDGSAGVTGVKTLILKCEDFRTIRLTFLKSKKKMHTFLETKANSMDEEVSELGRLS